MKSLLALVACAGLVAASPLDAAVGDAADASGAAAGDVSLPQDAFSIYSSKSSCTSVGESDLI